MHVVVNAAQSVDGKLATRQREQLRISGPADFARVARVRADSDAIVVGVGTVLADDPHLTIDDDDLIAERVAANRPAQPARVVVDSAGRTPTDARIIDETATTYLLVSEATPVDRRAALDAAGADVIVVGDETPGNETAGDETAGDETVRDDARVDLTSAFVALAERGIDRLMVEGGGEVIFSCVEAGLVDTLHVYIGSMLIGGRDAPTLADGEGFIDDFPTLELTGVKRLDDGVVLSYDVSGS